MLRIAAGAAFPAVAAISVHARSAVAAATAVAPVSRAFGLATGAARTSLATIEATVAGSVRAVPALAASPAIATVAISDAGSTFATGPAVPRGVA
ncbi:hypothetical protein [Engelhardtia mirabilis]|uniref:hypothetical protein n=1 Tax=Engelhardtia mirabilis TaxID=2528011 RepID=UPI0011A0463F